jgi:hypothetical protein
MFNFECDGEKKRNALKEPGHACLFSVTRNVEVYSLFVACFLNNKGTK